MDAKKRTIGLKQLHNAGLNLWDNPGTLGNKVANVLSILISWMRYGEPYRMHLVAQLRLLADYIEARVECTEPHVKVGGEVIKISQDHIDALHQYAKWAGRNWKSMLREDWMRSGSNYPGEWAYLQQLRNRIGPTGLGNLNLTEWPRSKKVEA